MNSVPAQNPNTDVMDELLLWVALMAGGVKGKARADIVRAGGAEQALDQLANAATARARAQLARGFLASGGHLLGGAVALGRAERLRPPLVLFARGGLAYEPPGPMIGVVGARQCTAAGAKHAHQIARELVQCGATVVSGGAIGIDVAAHEGAVLAGGRTIAVLGTTVRADGTNERPATIRSLFESAPDDTLSVTAYGPWMQPHFGHFAARNDLLAGMCDAVIVVQGAAGSGTRHTVHAARMRGIALFALPGDVDAPTSAIPNALLRAGRPYLPGGSGQSDLGLVASSPAPALATATPLVTGLQGLQAAVWRGLQNEPEHVERLIARVSAAGGCTASEVLAALTELELQGHAVVVAAGVARAR